MSKVMSTLRVRTENAKQSQKLAAAIADVLIDGDLMVLLGDIGAGKTCFTQGLARGLGVAERVTSPTFTLVNHYQGRLELHHLDVYRIDDIADTTDLDLYELAEQGVTVVEWGSQIDPVLPTDRLQLTLRLPPCGDVPLDEPTTLQESEKDLQENVRIISLEVIGERWADRLTSLTEAVTPWRFAC